MNNSEFRKLLFDKPAQTDNGSTPRPAAPSALGAKKTSFAPMTPRAGSGSSNADFARQVRERHAGLQPRSLKKLKSSAPKGSKFGKGYVDRAKARAEAEDEEDDRGKRVKALEDQVKLGLLPRETFEALRDTIIGGDVSSTHLVSGLDWRLLEKVKRGEDVFGESGQEEVPPLDVDEELDKLEKQAIETVAKEKTQKQGNIASSVAGVKRSRDDIMAELKAQRKAAAEAKAANAMVLDSRWQKVGESARPKIEIDSKGREVLITVDEDGVVKKKIRKAAAGTAQMPDASKAILGSEIVGPVQPKLATVEQDEDDDIFAGAGTEYDPLADEDDSSGNESENERPVEPPKRTSPGDDSDTRDNEDSPHDAPPEPPKVESVRRNYFNETETVVEETHEDRLKAIERVLHKVAKMEPAAVPEPGYENESKEAKEVRLAKRAKMLANQDRDMDDMDLGFGSSRMDDEDEGEDVKIRLSEWKGGAAGDDDGPEGKKRGEKKKRKPNKRKGDVNSAADIMRVIEGRKAGSSK